MRFGPVALEEAEGATLAHSIRAGGRRFGKGEVLSADDVAALREAGVSDVTVAHFEADDLPEDEAAARVAAALGGEGLSISAPFTGRVNVFAEAPGLLAVDAGKIDAANRIDEAVTIATLPHLARVAPRQMLATVKIIPYAAPETAVAEATRVLSGALTLHGQKLRRASVFLTKTPGMKESLIAKGAAAVEARLAALNVASEAPVVTAHETDALATALAGAEGEIILILGGSATSDRNDVGPAAVVAAGGRIERFGMPVDPGNLLFLGELGGRPVLGLPGCARSPKLNGVDWVLERLICGVPVGSADIQAMGVGGLLKEIPSRPQPRGGEIAAKRPKVSALLLAAGSSSRMRGADKLMEDVGGEPLIRRSARRLLASGADEAIVVLRPGDEARRAALEGLDCRIVENPLAAEGMGASIRAGMAEIAAEAEAALIALADMPEIATADFDRLIAAYDAEEGREIVRAATSDRRAGNPVLFGRRFFEPLRALEGDEGARSLLAAHAELVRLVSLTGEHARIDLDTPEDWAAWRKGRDLTE
ncbi:MAG: molybdopterin-binding/glycosyltransferase family 2 protein [Pseudomonadota bacterium]